MLKAAADLFPQAIFLINRQQRIILANNAAQSLTAIEETNLIGQDVKTILALEDPQTQTKLHKVKLPKNNLVVLQAKVHAVPYAVTFLPLDYIPYFTAFKPRPAALAIINPQGSTQAEDQTTPTIYLQIMGQLVMRVAHDFGNSLTFIMGTAELIEEHLAALALQPPDGDTLKQLLDQTLPEVQNLGRKSSEMAQFIRTLQEYAKQQPTTGHSLDLNTAIRETITLARSLVGRKIQIEFLPSDNIPRIFIDRLRIDQILLSILDNAKTTMPTGGRITIETDKAILDKEFVSHHPGSHEGSFIRLSIGDSSEGLEPEKLKYIFDFPKNTKPANSLGLATVYSILKQFRGYIAVNSWQGKGTRFDIYIPETPPPSILTNGGDDDVLVLNLGRPYPTTLVPTTLIATHSPGATNLILIAEDDADIANTIEKVLEKEGYQTIATSDGQAALNRYRSLTQQNRQPELLIADFGLPNIDGRVLCNTIREEYPGANLLLTSGYRIQVDGNDDKTKDGLHFLQKPFSPSVLLSTVKKLLSKPTL